MIKGNKVNKRKALPKIYLDPNTDTYQVKLPGIGLGSVWFPHWKHAYCYIWTRGILICKEGTVICDYVDDSTEPKAIFTSIDYNFALNYQWKLGESPFNDYVRGYYWNYFVLKNKNDLLAVDLMLSAANYPNHKSAPLSENIDVLYEYRKTLTNIPYKRIDNLI